MFLGGMMVRGGMEVFLGVYLFSINLVGKGSLRVFREENVKEGKEDINFSFHCELGQVR